MPALGWSSAPELGLGGRGELLNELIPLVLVLFKIGPWVPTAPGVPPPWRCVPGRLGVPETPHLVREGFIAGVRVPEGLVNVGEGLLQLVRSEGPATGDRLHVRSKPVERLQRVDPLLAVLWGQVRYEPLRLHFGWGGAHRSGGRARLGGGFLGQPHR